MSFVPLDRVEFSRDESTPPLFRCKSPLPTSEHSLGNGSRIQPAPNHQASIPRHRRTTEEHLLRTIDESVSDLRDELHQSGITDERATLRIADICHKLDVIASVVLRHEKQLKETSPQRSVAKAPDDEADIMKSIMNKVQDVNAMLANVSGNFRGAEQSKTRSLLKGDTSSTTREIALPLYRIAEALDSVTKEVQRQHRTIEKLTNIQMSREEDDRIATIMSQRPPSAIGFSDHAPPMVETNYGSGPTHIRKPTSTEDSRIEPDEASPRRSRCVDRPIDTQSADEFLSEQDIDYSPSREHRRCKTHHGVTPQHNTVARKATLFEPKSSDVKTVSKQPEYLLLHASSNTGKLRPKSVCRADIFDSSSAESDCSPKSLDRTQSDVRVERDQMIAQLKRENESLKEQLFRQLKKNDDLRHLAAEFSATPSGRLRSVIA